METIVGIGKFAEARANSAVAGTELNGKIKVITLHYLLCNTSLCSKNTRWKKSRKIKGYLLKGTVVPWDLIVMTFEIPRSVLDLLCLMIKAFRYTNHILLTVRRLLPPSSG